MTQRVQTESFSKASEFMQTSQYHLIVRCQIIHDLQFFDCEEFGEVVPTKGDQKADQDGEAWVLLVLVIWDSTLIWERWEKFTNSSNGLRNCDWHSPSDCLEQDIKEDFTSSDLQEGFVGLDESVFGEEEYHLVCDTIGFYGSPLLVCQQLGVSTDISTVGCFCCGLKKDVFEVKQRK